jgi:excisionase family DNA binding protein
MLKVHEVAQRLQLSRGTAYKLIGRGVIPSVRIGHTVRVDERELERFLRRNAR